MVASRDFAGVSPAAVAGAASQELALLDERLWAGASDEELVDGILEFQAVKAQWPRSRRSCWPRPTPGTSRRSSCTGARPRTGYPCRRDDSSRGSSCGRARAGAGRAAAGHARRVPGRGGLAGPGRRSCAMPWTAPSSPVLRDEGERVLLEESRQLNATDLARTARTCPRSSTLTAPSGETRQLWSGGARRAPGRFYSVVGTAWAGPGQGLRPH